MFISPVCEHGDLGLSQKKKSINFAKQRKLITLAFVLDATIAGIQKC